MRLSEKCARFLTVPQFGKDAFRLSAIDEAPFYGMKVGGEPLCTLDGIVVNDRFQPLDDEAKPIEGLYVIGNDSGRFYCHTYPNFGAGTNAGRCAAAVSYKQIRAHAT